MLIKVLVGLEIFSQTIIVTSLVVRMYIFGKLKNGVVIMMGIFFSLLIFSKENFQ